MHIGGVSYGRTGLGSLCLTKSRGVPRMCVGEVESCEKCGNYRKISVNKAIKT